MPIGLFSLWFDR